MATVTYDARLQLKYDSYDNWKANNPVLLEGEPAFAWVKADSAENPTQNTPPVILVKVGDGVTEYNLLPFASGSAADVYAWAKAATKPTYTADEIDGLDAYISGEVNDTDTQYQIVKVDDYTYKLQSKALDAADWTDVTDSTIVIPKYDDTALADRVTSVEGSIATLNGDDQTAGSVAKAIADAIAALDLDGLSDCVTAVEGEVDTLVGTDTGKSVRTIANEELAAQLIPADAQESLNTLQEIAAWIQDHPDDAAAMNAAITALQTKTELGVDEDGNEYATVKLYVEAAIAALAIGDYAKAADLTALAARVETLEDKAHEHTNATVLDTIDDAKVAEWDAKVDEADLATVAKTGNVNDLVQTAGDYIIFKCGSSSELI